MYDTLASLSGCKPCNSMAMGSPYGLAGCGGERAARDRAENEKNQIKHSIIPNLQKELEEYKNGRIQKQYKALEDELIKLRLDIGKLEAEKARVLKVRDAWRDNPDLASKDPALALGSWFSRAFSCEHYVSGERDFLNEIKSLNKVRGNLERELKILKEKLSPEAIKQLSDSKTAINSQINSLKSEIASYRTEIKTYQNARATRLEAEKLAVQKASVDATISKAQLEANEKIKNAQMVANAKLSEEQAKNEALRAKLDNQPKPKESNTNMLLMGGAVLLGILLLRGGGNKTVIKTRG